MSAEEEAEYWTIRGRSSQAKVHLDPDCDRLDLSDRDVRPASEEEAEKKGVCAYCTGDFEEIAADRHRQRGYQMRTTLEEMDPDEFP